MAKLEIREIESNELVHTVDVTGKSERHVDRVMSGLLCNMDSTKYYVSHEED